VRHGVRVTGLERDADGRVVGVLTTGPGGRTARLRTRFVVGADGLRSTVAEAVGARVAQHTPAGGEVLFRYHADLAATGYEWAYGPGVAAGLIPTNDGLTCVFVSTSKERMRLARQAGTQEAFESLFAAAAPAHRDRLHAATPVGKMYGWGAVRGFVRRSWGPGWALVGDAGYFKDPITAHGMTDALRDAELLADAIVTAASGAQEEQVALASYQQRRDALSRHLFTVTHQIASYDWDMGRIRRLLRETSAAMTDEVEHLEGLPRQPRTRAAAGLPGHDIALARE
jgi:2-polyprenyl-6-methoxyphenol hydroxylase-like FAD-dependent oxidoreductase